MPTAGQSRIESHDRHPVMSARPELAFPVLPRTHLLRALDSAADSGRVILLSAPAGSGKTVLLRSWLEHRQAVNPGVRTVWVAADEGTGRELWAALLREFAESTAGSRPRTPRPRATRGGAGLAAVPDATATSDTATIPNSAAMARLLEDLVGHRGPVTMVLDTAQRITDAGVLEDLEYFLAHLPPTVTVAVSGRFDPPLRWHALELRGGLARFGAADLALTMPEVDELCRQHGCALDAPTLDRVRELTAGWAALVRMAALHLVAHPHDRDTAIATLARPPHAISAFLAREVLAPRGAEMHEFLLRTAVPARFTEALAERLGGHRAHELLDELDRTNFPLAHENRDGALHFIHHPLVRAHLMGETLRLDPSTLTALRVTTAHWNLAAGRPLSALDQLLYLPDPAPAREFVRDNALGVVLEGDGPGLFHRLEQADPVLATDPYVHLLRAVNCLVRGEIDTATAYLELSDAPGQGLPRTATVSDTSVVVPITAAHASRVQVGQAPTSSPAIPVESPDSGRGPSGAAGPDRGAYSDLPSPLAPAATVSCLPRDWLRVMRRAAGIELATATGGSLGEDDPAGPAPTGNQDIDAYATVQHAMVLLVRGEVAAGERQLRRALTLAEHTRHSRLALRSTNRLAVASGIEGSIAAMRERSQRAIDIATTHRLMDTPDALQAVVMTALAAHVQGDDQGSRFFAGILAEYGRRGAFGPGSHEHVVAQLLAFESAADRYSAAQSLRHSMSVLVHRSQPPLTLGVLVQSVWTLLRVPDSRAAQQLVAEARRAVGAHPAVLLCEAGLARAANKARSVHTLTAPLVESETPLNPLMAVLAWLLDATAHAELGNSLKAYEGMANALLCAEPEHLVRPFLEVPGALDLLDAFTGRFGHDDAFAARIRHHPAAARGPATHPALTTTELTVLKQLPSGRTTQQIADDLGVSINTVKTHMRGIYGKLGTSSRTEALDRARRTGLL